METIQEDVVKWKQKMDEFREQLKLGDLPDDLQKQIQAFLSVRAYNYSIQNFRYLITNALHQYSTAVMLLSPATALKFCVQAGVYRGISAREAICHSRMWSPQRL